MKEKRYVFTASLNVLIESSDLSKCQLLHPPPPPPAVPPFVCVTVPQWSYSSATLVRL